MTWIVHSAHSYLDTFRTSIRHRLSSSPVTHKNNLTTQILVFISQRNANVFYVVKPFVFWQKLHSQISIWIAHANVHFGSFFTSEFQIDSNKSDTIISSLTNTIAINLCYLKHTYALIHNLEWKNSRAFVIICDAPLGRPNGIGILSCIVVDTYYVCNKTWNKMRMQHGRIRISWSGWKRKWNVCIVLFGFGLFLDISTIWCFITPKLF